MIKHYVLDTNVLLYDPNSVKMFEDNNIHIPMVVLEELDTFKRDSNELGMNARKIINFLDLLREKGKLAEGVKLDSGGMLFVSSSYKKIDPSLSAELLDNKLLQLSSYLKTLNHGTKVVLVTKDINLRVKADALGIDAQDYKKPSEGNGTDYEGVGELTIDKNFIDRVYSENCADLEDKSMFLENQYIILTDSSDPKHTGLGMYRDGMIFPLRKKFKAVSISPNNVRQTFALDALLDPDIKVVTISGISGTGKTLLCVAAAIQQTLIDNDYQKITITRPTVSVGNELGFLPGDISEKLDPWIKPIYDSLDLIKELDKKSGKSKITIQADLENYIEIAPLCYIRGRSLINSFMIVDESQNLSPLEIKTIVTRVGQGTKIIFTGDVCQIDSPYLNRHSNGLSQLIKRFKGKAFYAHITLTEGERSEVAEAAAELL